MDKVFEKFGLYDFMGIWGPGIIFCIYCTFTFPNLVNIIFESLNTDTIVKYLIFYIGIAYLIGVILHEIGKFFADIITYFFDFDKYSDIDKLKLKNGKNMRWFVPRHLQYKYRKILQDCKVTPSVKFDYAYSKLKYSKNVDRKRINVYHSVYGLSRGFLFAFTIHLLVLVLIKFLKPELIIANNTIVFVSICVIDIILMYVFFCRTIRYFTSWIANVYIQYDIVFNNSFSKDAR